MVTPVLGVIEETLNLVFVLYSNSHLESVTIPLLSATLNAIDTTPFLVLESFTL